MNCILNFANNKNFFWSILSISFSKNVFVFCYSDMITSFKFRIFSTEIFIVFGVGISCKKAVKKFLEKAVMCLIILFFKVLLNLSTTADFLSLYVEYISILFIFKNLLKDCCKLYHFDKLIFWLDVTIMSRTSFWVNSHSIRS